MELEISEAGENGYSAVIRSIDQGVLNIPASTMTATGDSVRFEVRSAFSCEGMPSPDGNDIDGNQLQGGLTPLPLKRVDAMPQLNRPLTPRKPYPLHNTWVSAHSYSPHFSGRGAVVSNAAIYLCDSNLNISFMVIDYFFDAASIAFPSM